MNPDCSSVNCAGEARTHVGFDLTGDTGPFVFVRGLMWPLCVRCALNGLANVHPRAPRPTSPVNRLEKWV